MNYIFVLFGVWKLLYDKSFKKFLQISSTFMFQSKKKIKYMGLEQIKGE